MKVAERRSAGGASLARSGAWCITWVVMGAVICAVTASVFLFSSAQVKKTAHARLEAQADESMFQIGRQYDVAVTMLRSMRGLYYASGDVTPDEFELFFRTSGFREIFPQFGVVAYAPRVLKEDKAAFEEKARMPVKDGGTGYPEFAIDPPGDRDEYWPVLYSVPTLPDLRGLGWDVRDDPARLAAIERARDIGDAVVSEDIALLIKERPGAALVVPMYATKDVPATLEGRRAAYSGVLGVTFAYEDFPLSALAVDRVKEYGLNVSVGPPGRAVSFYASPEAEPRFSFVYGDVTVVRHLEVNEFDRVDVTFSGPAAGLLTLQERLFPFGLAMTVFLMMLAALLIVALLRRDQALSELRQRYGFVASMSHQLRTPLTKLRWSMDGILASGAIKDAQVLDTMRGDVASLNAITDDLLLFLEWGGMRALDKTAKRVPVSAVVADALAHVRDPGLASRVRVDLDAAGPATVLADQKRLSTALWFLIDNALTYSPKDSPVSLSAAIDGSHVVIRVIDRGFGIPKAEQAGVLDYFFRASNASLGKNAGSGVGIPLCATIVKAHGGAIEFESEEDKGSTFAMRLPLRG